MDTFIDMIIACTENMHINMDAVWAWLQCMPHTIHLTALKI
jgi:hypothetical protein